MSEPPLIYVIAGEPSGDAIGGKLMAALRERTGGAVRFAGIGGEAMAAQGLASPVALHELAIMGIAEVLPRARTIIRHAKAAAAEIRRLRPAAVVTIDSSGFTWRVAQRLREGGEKELPLIHYVAPMVWAWRGGRARRMARWYDHLMTLLPFEPPYFHKVGLAATYVGHPVIESGADRGDGPGFRRRFAISPAAKVLAVLPGSRRGEVRKLLAPFGGAVERLAAAHPGLVVVMPTTETVAEMVTEGTRSWPVPVHVLRGERDKYDAFAAAEGAIAASGTVALELALARVPAIIAYRVAPSTLWFLRTFGKVEYAHMVNIMLRREAVPELIQGDCNAERLAAEIERLWGDPALRAAQAAAGREVLLQLGLGELRPSRRAAEVVLDIIARRRLAPSLTAA